MITILPLLLTVSCSKKNIIGTEFRWDLPDGIPAPYVPEENPMTVEKVALGRRLFYDKRLSQDQTMSCASCHVQKFAFSDRKKTPRGIPSGTGDLHPRNAQHLSNAAYYSMLTWANPVLSNFEVQMRVPLFFTANAIRELGLEGDDYLRRLRNDKTYLEMFAAAFGAGKPETIINEANMRFAIASFERSLLSFNSPYDRHRRGEKNAMSESALRGMELFNGDQAKCSRCHSGFNFTESVVHYEGKAVLFYRNNGLYSGAYYASKNGNERGLFEFTQKPEDVGRFRVPSLRNVALTFPYMHDGSISCSPNHSNDDDACATEALGKVIDHYRKGGAAGSEKDENITGFELTEQEKNDLIEFLKSLTDREFITNPSFSDPFGGEI